MPYQFSRVGALARELLRRQEPFLLAKKEADWILQTRGATVLFKRGKPAVVLSGTRHGVITRLDREAETEETTTDVLDREALFPLPEVPPAKWEDVRIE